MNIKIINYLKTFLDSGFAMLVKEHRSSAISLSLFIVILILFSNKYYSNDFYKNLLVELHGVAADIVILGVLFSIIKRQSGKNERIDASISRIDELIEKKELTSKDFSTICNDLNKDGVKTIEIHHCSFTRWDLKGFVLKDSKLIWNKYESMSLKKLKFQNCNAQNSTFEGCEINKASFLGSSFDGSTFKDVKFKNVNFSDTDMNECNFCDVVFDECKMQNANLYDSKFEKVKVLKCKYLPECLKEFETQ